MPDPRKEDILKALHEEQAENAKLCAEVEKLHGEYAGHDHWWTALDAARKERDAALLQVDELAEKWAAAAQTVHDLRAHPGSFPFCMTEPCYSAWAASEQSRRAEKPFHVEGQPGDVCGPCGVAHPVTEKRIDECRCAVVGNATLCPLHRGAI